MFVYNETTSMVTKMVFWSTDLMVSICCKKMSGVLEKRWYPTCVHERRKNIINIGREFFTWRADTRNNGSIRMINFVNFG